jgi:membrane protein
VVLALYFASNGIESLRIGLNRAYSVKEMRPWYLLRLESIGYVLVASVAMLAVSFLVVLGPLAWATALRFFPGLEPFGWTVTFIRLAAAALVLVVTLIVVHLWLPGGRRTIGDVWPGIVVTLLLWLGAGAAFGRYLAEFVTTYAGLASVMIALAFLYFAAAIFVYGGELNSVIEEERRGLRR